MREIGVFSLDLPGVRSIVGFNRGIHGESDGVDARLAGGVEVSWILVIPVERCDITGYADTTEVFLIYHVAGGGGVEAFAVETFENFADIHTESPLHIVGERLWRFAWLSLGHAKRHCGVDTHDGIVSLSHKQLVVA